MSTELYRYTPRPGEFIALTATMSVPSIDVPMVARDLLAALYEAAGLPVPIALDRTSDATFSAWMEVKAGHVLLDIRRPLSLTETRQFAAALAGAVERAENEPDPAEVERLAEVIHEAREHCGGAGEWDRQSARTILARYTLTERRPGAGS